MAGPPLELGTLRHVWVERIVSLLSLSLIMLLVQEVNPYKATVLLRENHF